MGCSYLNNQPLRPRAWRKTLSWKRGSKNKMRPALKPYFSPKGEPRRGAGPQACRVETHLDACLEAFAAVPVEQAVPSDPSGSPRRSEHGVCSIFWVLGEQHKCRQKSRRGRPAGPRHAGNRGPTVAVVRNAG